MQSSTHNVIRDGTSYKQLEVKTNRIWFLCGHRNRHHNAELRTKRHIIEQHKTKLKGRGAQTPPKTSGAREG